MGVFMFITFLIGDLITCLICKYVYCQNFVYQNGMLLGVHIPREQVQHPQVEALCSQSKRQWSLYQNTNIAAGSLLCLIGFFSVEWLVLVWIIWFLLYLGGMHIVMVTPMRRMYQLKQEQGWIREKSRRTIYIDTELSALSGRMAPKAYWHLLLLAAEAAAMAALYMHLRPQSGQDGAEALALGGVAMSVTLLVWAMRLYLVEKRNVVYSQSSKVNIAVNKLVKRTWAKAFLGADGWNCAAWLYLALRWFMAGNPGKGDWLVYALLQLTAAAAALLPWGNAIQKKTELLAADEQPVEVDDDEYWKTGWYENPQDPHLLVQNRLCDTNYTFNMAHPAARWINVGITLILVGSLGWVAWMMIEGM